MTRLLCFLLIGGSLVGATHQSGRRTAQPTVIDLDGDGFSFTSLEDGVNVDIDGDGVKEQTAWTSQGDDDAFLCVDDNRNGLIDVPFELLGGPLGPPVGLATLAAMDGIRPGDRERVRDRRPDGYLDKADAFFASIILWTDANHNGRSEEDELQSLTYAGIERVATGYEGVGSIDGAGNALQYRALASRAGRRGVAVMRDVVTVKLVRR